MDKVYWKRKVFTYEYSLYLVIFEEWEQSDAVVSPSPWGSWINIPSFYMKCYNNIDQKSKGYGVVEMVLFESYESFFIVPGVDSKFPILQVRNCSTL